MIAFLRGQLREAKTTRRSSSTSAASATRCSSSAATQACAAGRARSQLHVHTHFVTGRAAAPVRLRRRRPSAACSRRCSACRGSGRASRSRILAGLEADELVRAIATGGRGPPDADQRGGAQDSPSGWRWSCARRSWRLPAGGGRAPGRRPARPRAVERASPVGRWARSTARSCSSATSRSRSSRCSSRWTPARPVADLCARRWRRCGGARDGAQATRRRRRRRAPTRAVSPERLASAGPRSRRGRGAAAAQLRGVRRPAEDRREHGGLRPGGAQARRRAGPRAAVGAAGPGQDDARLPARARDGDRGARDVGARRWSARATWPGILTSLGRGDVLFIDEIHRLQPVIEESLYPAMEDFRIELVTGTGAGARAITAAASSASRWSARRRAPGSWARRCSIASASSSRSSSTTPDELTTIVLRSARLLGIADRRRGRRRDRPARARHAAHRQPPAAPDPRLRRGARRRPHHPRRSPSSRSAGWRSTRSGSTRATARS